MNNPVIIKLPNGTQLLRSEDDNVWATRFGYEGMPITTDPEIIAEDLEQCLEDELIIGNEGRLMQALADELRLNIGMQKTIDKLRISSDQGESTRLIEALEELKGIIAIMQDASESSNLRYNAGNMALHKIDQALSSHREDTGKLTGETFTVKLAPPIEDTGIQNVRDYYDSLKESNTSYDIDQIHGMKTTLNLLGITIPGITEER
jgi:hypothetical protein